MTENVLKRDPNGVKIYAIVVKLAGDKLEKVEQLVSLMQLEQGKSRNRALADALELLKLLPKRIENEEES